MATLPARRPGGGLLSPASSVQVQRTASAPNLGPSPVTGTPVVVATRLLPTGQLAGYASSSTATAAPAQVQVSPGVAHELVRRANPFGMPVSVSQPRSPEAAPAKAAPEASTLRLPNGSASRNASDTPRSRRSRSQISPRSARSTSQPPPFSRSLTSRIQGVANCPLCHALLQIFAGRVRIQAFLDASELPAPSLDVVQRALAGELSEEEDLRASSNFCRFYQLHHRRYNLWLKGQEAIRRCTARGDAKAATLVRKCAEEIGQLDAIMGQVESEWLETFAAFFKQLQQDVREQLFKTLMGKAEELVKAWESEMDEVNQEIDKKVKQKRHRVSEAVSRRHESAREDYWRQHEKQCAKQFVHCLVQNARNLHTGRAHHACSAFKDLEIEQKARRPFAERHVESRASCRAEAERAKREREMKIWLSKMDQLQTLQHLQACKDRELVYLRVAMTIRRLEEDQGVEHRLVVLRASQHVQQMRTFLEKTLRTQGLCSSSDLTGITPGSIVLENESFMQMVLRNERAIGDATACSPRSARSHGPGATIDSPGMSLNTGFSSSGISLDLRGFGEFLGARFPSLRAALGAMDLTGSGRVACFELESWLRQQMYPGDARMLLKDLGRKGSLGLSQLRPLAECFVRSSAACGRPSGATAAALLRLLCSFSDARARRYQPFEAFQSAVRCCRCVCSFLNSNISVDVACRGHDLNEAVSLTGTARLGDQGLETFHSGVSSSGRRARGAAAESGPSLAEIGSRSKLEAVKGSVDKRVSTMHYQRRAAGTETREALTPRRLRADHVQRREAELQRRLGPLPKCIATIRGRAARDRASSPPRSRSNSPKRQNAATFAPGAESTRSDTLTAPVLAEPTQANANPSGAEVASAGQGDDAIVPRRAKPLTVSLSADSSNTAVRSASLLPVPSSGGSLVRSPSAPVVLRSPAVPVVVRTISVGSGAPSYTSFTTQTPRTLSPQASAVPAQLPSKPVTRELSPRVHWGTPTLQSESGRTTPRILPGVSASPRTALKAPPAASTAPALVLDTAKAQVLPAATLLPLSGYAVSTASPRLATPGSPSPVTTFVPAAPTMAGGTPVSANPSRVLRQT